MNPPREPEHVIHIPASMAALIEPMKAIVREANERWLSGSNPEEFCRSERFQQVMATYRAAIVDFLANCKKPTR